jgi:hypothetical protein
MDTSKIAELEKSIARASSLIQLYKSPQFQEYLLPILKEMAIVHPIDPSIYKVREMYQYEMMIKNAEAFAIKKIIQYLDNQESIMTNNTKQLYTLRQIEDAKRTTKVTR